MANTSKQVPDCPKNEFYNFKVRVCTTCDDLDCDSKISDECLQCFPPTPTSAKDFEPADPEPSHQAIFISVIVVVVVFTATVIVVIVYLVIAKKEVNCRKSSTPPVGSTGKKRLETPLQSLADSVKKTRSWRCGPKSHKQSTYCCWGNCRRFCKLLLCTRRDTDDCMSTLPIDESEISPWKDSEKAPLKDSEKAPLEVFLQSLQRPSTTALLQATALNETSNKIMETAVIENYSTFTPKKSSLVVEQESSLLEEQKSSPLGEQESLLLENVANEVCLSQEPGCGVTESASTNHASETIFFADMRDSGDNSGFLYSVANGTQEHTGPLTRNIPDWLEQQSFTNAGLHYSHASFVLNEDTSSYTYDRPVFPTSSSNGDAGLAMASWDQPEPSHGFVSTYTNSFDGTSNPMAILFDLKSSGRHQYILSYNMDGNRVRIGVAPNYTDNHLLQFREAIARDSAISVDLISMFRQAPVMAQCRQALR